MRDLPKFIKRRPKLYYDLEVPHWSCPHLPLQLPLSVLRSPRPAFSSSNATCFFLLHGLCPSCLLCLNVFHLPTSAHQINFYSSFGTQLRQSQILSLTYSYHPEFFLTTVYDYVFICAITQLVAICRPVLLTQDCKAHECRAYVSFI